MRAVRRSEEWPMVDIFARLFGPRRRSIRRALVLSAPYHVRFSWRRLTGGVRATL